MRTRARRTIYALSSSRSFDARATGFRFLRRLGFVFMRGRGTAGNGVVGPGAKINVDVVDEAHHVHVRRERWHDLVVGGVDIFASVGDYGREVGVTHRL